MASTTNKAVSGGVRQDALTTIATFGDRTAGRLLKMMVSYRCNGVIPMTQGLGRLPKRAQSELGNIIAQIDKGDLSGHDNSVC